MYMHSLLHSTKHSSGDPGDIAIKKATFFKCVALMELIFSWEEANNKEKA